MGTYGEAEKKKKKTFSIHTQAKAPWYVSILSSND